jgi:hypothetical protein
MALTSTGTSSSTDPYAGIRIILEWAESTTHRRTFTVAEMARILGITDADVAALVDQGEFADDLGDIGEPTTDALADLSAAELLGRRREITYIAIREESDSRDLAWLRAILARETSVIHPEDLPSLIRHIRAHVGDEFNDEPRMRQLAAYLASETGKLDPKDVPDLMRVIRNRFYPLADDPAGRQVDGSGYGPEEN